MISLEYYKIIMSKPPEKRVAESSGDLLNDKIDGILIGFAKCLELRSGWIDMITVKEAKKEIMELIKNAK